MNEAVHVILIVLKSCRNHSSVMKRFSLLSLGVLALSFSCVGSATAWECPTFDEERVMDILQICIEDKDGLCGTKCIEALVNGALAVKDETEIPCEGGVEGVMENVLKRCTEENGGTFDPCDGNTERIVIENAANFNCIGGGTLADQL